MSISAISETPKISGGQLVAAGTNDLPQSAHDTGVSDMSFGDFLDMINPLQHIPIVSSIYRAATGDTINPVARIAGDTLYGAALGVATGGVAIAASAGVAALGAIGDEVYAANNGGENTTGTMMAALFGKNKDQTVQVARNDVAPAPEAAPTIQVAADKESDPTTQAMQVAAALPQTPATQTNATPVPTQVADAGTKASDPIAALQAVGAQDVINKGMPLDRSKMAYGGVMDPGLMQNAMQNQTLALALATGKDTMDSAHALRNSRFASNVAQVTTNPTKQSASLPLPGETPTLSGAAAVNPATAMTGANNATPVGNMVQNLGFAQSQSMIQGLPQTSFANQMKASKGLDQYRNTAMSVPAVGGSLDVTN